jgi:uncharacterized NAD(P)/FAD-binding protein YdhS
MQSAAIIGGGASGLLTAIQLLRQGGHRGPRVYLIEKQDTFGFGPAYATKDPSHLLNVRAGNMSAFPGQPLHFVEWLQSNCAEGAKPIDASSFVTRQTYGRYLRSLLREAATGVDAAGRFYAVPDEAVSVEALPDGRFAVRLAIGKDIEANCVVLAMGNAPPDPPAAADSSVLASRHYVGDPWSLGFPQSVDANSTIFILGTGLTMVDAVLSLVRLGHRGPIAALSRRGLLPRRHASTAPTEISTVAASPLISNVVADLRSMRRALREHCLRGGDWRDIIDALRPITVSYWRSLSLVEQQRFLRHLRPWWDVHRHRLAPAAADELDALIASGRLKLLRGQLSGISLSGDPSGPVAVSWRARGSATALKMHASMIVNCMGPGGDPSRSPSELTRQMLGAGLIKPDALNLGLAVDSAGRLINRLGFVQPGLFALGPITRGTFWEITAIPDIRVKAAEVAAAVLLRLQERAHTIKGKSSS